MNFVFAIGETIYDIIFDANAQPVAARPGGSMLNTAVSLGRCGIPVEMITELGEDRVGRLVLEFLKTNSVSASYIQPYPDFKTPVSLAFLDNDGNAAYAFYKAYPDNRLNIKWPDVSRGDVVLFGSFYSLDKEIRERVIYYLRKAKHNGGLIVYDPNIRKNHLAEVRDSMDMVIENISLADIVRGSDEDFINLFGLDDGEKIFRKIRETGCNCLIITKGPKGAWLFCKDARLHVPAKKIKVKSTIGAGDAFNAGIIFGIVRKGYNVDDLVNIKEQQWSEIMGLGITFATDVCKSYDNYISFKSARNFK